MRRSKQIKKKDVKAKNRMPFSVNMSFWKDDVDDLLLLEKIKALMDSGTVLATFTKIALKEKLDRMDIGL